MGRAAKFTDDEILDAAMELIARDGIGASTVVAVAEAVGAPSGSVYHRFASRDLLYARLWVRTVERFHVGFLEALRLDDVDEAARSAIVHTVRWSRENPAGASVLLRYRREDLVTRWPDELGDRLADLNRPVIEALSAFALRRFGSSSPALASGAAFAITVIPYAAVRSHALRGDPLTVVDEELAAVAGLAVLDHLAVGVDE